MSQINNMKKRTYRMIGLALFCLILPSIKGSCKETASQEVTLKIGKTKDCGEWAQTSVYPNNIEDTFVVDVCLPDDYDESKKYPVVYLTDCYWRKGDYTAIKALYEEEKTEPISH